MLEFTPEQAFYFALFYLLKDIILQIISFNVVVTLYKKVDKSQISKSLKFAIVILQIIYYATFLQYAICFSAI